MSFSFKSQKNKFLKENYCIKNERECRYVVGKTDKSVFDSDDHDFLKQLNIAYNFIDENGVTNLIFPHIKSKLSPGYLYSGSCHRGKFFLVERKFNRETKTFCHLNQVDKEVLKRMGKPFVEDDGDIRIGENVYLFLNL